MDHGNPVNSHGLPLLNRAINESFKTKDVCKMKNFARKNHEWPTKHEIRKCFFAVPISRYTVVHELLHVLSIAKQYPGAL